MSAERRGRGSGWGAPLPPLPSGPPRRATLSCSPSVRRGPAAKASCPSKSPERPWHLQVLPARFAPFHSAMQIPGPEWPCCQCPRSRDSISHLSVMRRSHRLLQNGAALAGAGLPRFDHPDSKAGVVNSIILFFIANSAP